MKLDKNSLLLYGVTDRSWLHNQTVAQQVEEAIIGGATFMQLREKNLSYEDFCTEARAVKAVTDRYGIPFVINDNVEVALAVNADGVHVGQEDMAAANVRELIGRDKILGVSVQSLDQALLAVEQGADYLGVGAVFATSTKSDAADVSRQTLKEICEGVGIPVVAIGGISLYNIKGLANSGIAGVAVVSAIFAEANISEATAKLKAAVSLSLKL